MNIINVIEDDKDKLFTLEDSKTSFVLIEKGNINNSSKNNKKKDADKNYGFLTLSYKELYSSNDLFKHVINHVDYFFANNQKNKENEKKFKNIKKIEEFIHQNKFTEDILKVILLNGIPTELTCLRPLIWKSFLGYYPNNDLSKWINITQYYNRKYKKIMEKYPQYPSNLTDQEDLKLLLQLNKDMPRTRAELSFFKHNKDELFLKKKIDKEKEDEIIENKETNYDVIKRILFYFAKEEKLSYVQGMNEFVALIYYTFANDDNPFFEEYIESDTYYCFTLLVKDIEPIFLLNGKNYNELLVVQKIGMINDILNEIVPELSNYFKEIDFSIDNFIMKWIMALFTQEFKIDIAASFWDRMFTQENKMDFICFVSVAILKMSKEQLIGKELDEISDWTRKMGENMRNLDINEIITLSFEIKHKYNEIIKKKKKQI